MLQFVTLAPRQSVRLIGTASAPAGPVTATIDARSTVVINIQYPGSTSHLPITLNVDSPNYQFQSQFIKAGETVVLNTSPNVTVYLAVQGKIDTQDSNDPNPSKRKNAPTKNDDDEEEQVVSPVEKKQKIAPEKALAKEKETKPVEKAPAKPTNQVHKLPNGLQYSDMEIGKGPSVAKGSTVAVRYQGLFTSGQIFDSNMPKGQLLTFTIGRGEVITGMEQGMLGMQTGGRRRMIIPSQLGYGKQGSPPVIPPNATLIFDVTLVKLHK